MSLATLKELRAHPGQARHTPAGSATIAGLGLSLDARARWLGELTRYQRECGCGTGGACATVGFLAATAWQLTHIEHPGLAVIAVGMLKVFGTAIPLAIVGKLAGLARARSRFRRAIGRLIAEVVAQQFDNGARES